ncbi:MAG: hypothetical protein PPHEESC_5829 [uncultured Paraburkholderia sp.]|nr:MAG: hypothetical protein PPHEESC_5829 [uncultured Paraburkholderia sp.]
MSPEFSDTRAKAGNDDGSAACPPEPFIGESNSDAVAAVDASINEQGQLAQMVQTAELAKRQQAGKAFHEALRAIQHSGCLLEAARRR